MSSLSHALQARRATIILESPSHLKKVRLMNSGTHAALSAIIPLISKHGRNIKQLSSKIDFNSLFINSSILNAGALDCYRGCSVSALVHSTVFHPLSSLLLLQCSGSFGPRNSVPLFEELPSRSSFSASSLSFFSIALTCEITLQIITATMVARITTIAIDGTTVAITRIELCEAIFMQRRLAASAR